MRNIFNNQLRAAMVALKEKEKATTTQIEQIQIQPATSFGGYNHTHQQTLITNNAENLRAEIKKERLAQGMTQRELATKSGMSQGTITRAERHLYISMWCLMRIVAALGKSITLK